MYITLVYKSQVDNNNIRNFVKRIVSVNVKLVKRHLYF